MSCIAQEQSAKVVIVICAVSWIEQVSEYVLKRSKREKTTGSLRRQTVPQSSWGIYVSSFQESLSPFGKRVS